MIPRSERQADFNRGVKRELWFKETLARLMMPDITVGKNDDPYEIDLKLQKYDLTKRTNETVARLEYEVFEGHGWMTNIPQWPFINFLERKYPKMERCLSQGTPYIFIKSNKFIPPTSFVVIDGETIKKTYEAKGFQPIKEDGGHFRGDYKYACKKAIKVDLSDVKVLGGNINEVAKFFRAYLGPNIVKREFLGDDKWDQKTL